MVQADHTGDLWVRLQRPVALLTVEPYRLQARAAGRSSVQVGIIANVQNGTRLYLQRLGRTVKHARIRLGKTRALHIEAVTKKLPNTDAVDQAWQNPCAAH